MRRIGQRPALATLSASLGTPAFSVARSRFILIEGTREGRERERFAAVLASVTADRFIEADSCSEVMTRARALRLLASHEEQLRVAAVVDGDFRSDDERQRLLSDDNVFALPVLEIENFFIQPELLAALLKDADRSSDELLLLLQRYSDRFAGKWAFERAKTMNGWNSKLGEAPRISRRLSWEDVRDDLSAAAQRISAAFECERAECIRRRTQLKSALEAYEAVRGSAELLWKECFGKQVLDGVARDLGFRESTFLESRAAVLWRCGEVPPSKEALALRAYLDSVPVLS